MIKVNKIEPLPQAVFKVVVEESEGDKTTHKVSLKEDYYEKLTHSTSSGQANGQIKN